LVIRSVQPLSPLFLSFSRFWLALLRGSPCFFIHELVLVAVVADDLPTPLPHCNMIRRRLSSSEARRQLVRGHLLALTHNRSRRCSNKTIGLGPAISRACQDNKTAALSDSTQPQTRPFSAHHASIWQDTLHRQAERALVRPHTARTTVDKSITRIETGAVLRLCDPGDAAIMSARLPGEASHAALGAPTAIEGL